MRYPRLNTGWISLLLLSMAAGAVPGCAGKSVDQNDPAALMKEAEDDIKSDHYQIALDKLRSIKNRFPYSKFALEAQLRIADVFFMQESFPEAAATYEAFSDLHPKHERVPYALFRAAKSYYNDSPSRVERDLTPAQKALTSYTEFLRRFPAAAEADEARKDVAAIRLTLAEKEMTIADFYNKRRHYDSAKTRYEKILALYPETAPAKAAQEKIAQISEKALQMEAAKKRGETPQ